MSSPTTELLKPTEIETAECESRGPSPRRSGKRTASESANTTPADFEGNRAKAARREPTSENRPAPIESDDESSSTASVADATDATMPPSHSPVPSTFLAASDSAAADAPSPERKIWMRACNGCGFELHLRRVRCTACGATQMSKRAFAAQQAAATTTVEGEAAASTARRGEDAAAEAQEAASQLAAIAEAPGDAPPAAMPPAEAPADDEDAEVEEEAAPPAANTSPAANSASVIAALARLTPEQIIKLRRMQKLRALLTKLPAGVTLPPRPVAGVAAAKPAAPSDAISMLASVACM